MATVEKKFLKELNDHPDGWEAKIVVYWDGLKSSSGYQSPHKKVNKLLKTYDANDIDIKYQMMLDKTTMLFKNKTDAISVYFNL